MHSINSQFENTGNPTPEIPVRILAVDDREENLVALEAVFQTTGYQLVTALSGHEALKILEEEDFAAVLLDVQMPVLDGFGTAKLMRQSPRAKNTPIIFLTAIDRSELYESKGYVSGAVDFLFKPVNIRILLAKVAVFADLFRARMEVQKNAEMIKQQALKQQEIEFLKHALTLRDDFISIAAHELNTPLTPLNLQMQLFLKLMDEDRLGTTDPVQLRRMLEISHSQVERLSRLIKDLIDVSRISNGKIRLKPDYVCLVEITRSVIESFHEQMRELGCAVEFNFEKEPVGYWDKMRIEQVLINLLSNSLKYGLRKPVNVRIFVDDNEQAVLQVEDHGVGIAKNKQPYIFDRYERAVSSENYGGLGLGLYISKEIIQLHSGTITVHSELGQGSLFEVRLPLQPTFPQDNV